VNDRTVDQTAARISRRAVLAAGAATPLMVQLGSSERVLAGPRPQAAPLPAGASKFVSVPPSRLADTRPDRSVGGYTRIDATRIRVQIAGRGGVPSDATAAVLNVTAVNTTLPGFVTAFPAGAALPFASNINVERAGQTLPNLVTVLLGVGGAIDVYTQNPSDLIVDVNGAYVPVAAAASSGRFVGLPTAFRAIDTRVTGTKLGIGAVQRVDVSSVVPATASAVVVNLTVTESNAAGFYTGYPAGGAQPDSSSLNTDGPTQTRANQAILPLGTVGAVRGIDVFSSSGGQLIVDVAGYFTGSDDALGTDGLFVPNAPYRTLDTRTDSRYGRLYPGWIAEFGYTGLAQSQAVVVNLTTENTRGPGFFTGYPARTPRPLASNLNATARHQTIANHAILRTSTAGVAVYTQSGGNLIVDVAGYFMGTPVVASLPAPVNVVPPPPPPAQPPYTLRIPALGVVSTVFEGVGNNIVDAGYAGHWPGTGFAGEQSHMVLFAHRTAHGGMLRYLHLLGPGDQISLEVNDGRVFTYAYFSRAVVGHAAADIYNVGLVAPIPSVSLVACSKLNTLPTDIRYRLVVTFTLVNIDE
jgi:hypothetical protein